LPTEPMRDLGRLLVILGLTITLVGLLLSLGPKLPFRIGRLPGDIIYKRDNFTFYFPVVTSIALSVVLTLVFWILGRRS
jgi:DUF2905 family protein